LTGEAYPQNKRGKKEFYGYIRISSIFSKINSQEFQGYCREFVKLR
jgi:hypothetical protein